MRKLVGLVLPLASLSVATIVACSSSKKTTVIIDSGSNGSGSGSGSAIACTMANDPACPSGFACDTTNMVCVEICPAGPTFPDNADPLTVTGPGGSGSGFLDSITWRSETEGMQASGSGSDQGFYKDGSADANQPYYFRVQKALGTQAAPIGLRIYLFEQGGSPKYGEKAEGASFPPAGTCTIPAANAATDVYCDGFSDSIFNAKQFSIDIIGLANLSGNTFQDQYLAVQGTITLSTNTVGNVSGHMDNMIFAHYNADGSPAADNCQSQTNSLTWSGSAVQTHPAAFSGRDESTNAFTTLVNPGAPTYEDHLKMQAFRQAWLLAHPKSGGLQLQVKHVE